ncbi:MAG: EamA family transporter [Clostridia bacterium]|nr:EamA family transporter [Clostridia bacterium]
MKLSKNAFYPACIITAGIFWGLSSLFVRGLEANGVSMAEICFLRATVAMAIMVIAFAILSPSTFKIKIKDIWIFALSGVISILGVSYTYFTAIELSSASFACIMMYTAPIFVAIFSRVLFKEKITLGKIMCLVVTFTGCVMCAYKEGGFSVDLPVILVGLASGVAYASYSVFSRLATDKGYGANTIMCYSFIFAAIGSAILVPYDKLAYNIASGNVDILTVLGLGVIVTAIPYLAYTVGLKGVEMGKASIMACIEIVTATLLGIIAFNEVPEIIAIIGMVTVFAGVVMMNVSNPPKLLKGVEND